jgi:hypothetical protein
MLDPKIAIAEISSDFPCFSPRRRFLDFSFSMRMHAACDPANCHTLSHVNSIKTTSPPG